MRGWVGVLCCVGGLGCGETVCANDPACVVETPCAELAFACEGGFAWVEVVSDTTELPSGLPALASNGDFVLRSDRVVAVIDAIDHPHYVAPTGGSLLDLATVAGDVDGLNNVFQATGLLPGDAVRYLEARAFEGAGFAAVQVRGHLDGHPDQPVITRYEVRPCEPGVRVRTEALNLEPDPAVWTLTDGWYWGGRSNVPFVPYRGVGFDYPDIELTSLTDSFRAIPFLATLPAAGSPVTYASIACGTGSLHGFHSDDVSAAGRAPRIVPFRDFEVFERFYAVANGTAVSPAADIALEVRRQLYGEPWAELRGRVAGASAETVRVRVEQGRMADPVAARTPATEIAPAADGSFAARVPAGRDYVIAVDVFGREESARELHVPPEGAAAGVVDLTPAGQLHVEVTVDGATDHALVFVEPADDATRDRVGAASPGEGRSCAPMLGPPHGASPACNRVLVSGPVDVPVPAGRYRVYATAGPFATIARAEVTVEPGGAASAALALSLLPLAPAGTLSADFHVHGGASFDSSIPDGERARAFLAARVDVLASTEHDVVNDYAEALADLGADGRLVVLPGVETTGHVLFDYVPGSDVPQVIGHWNFWPLPEAARAPWRGAPWDELVEPGLLFDRIERAGWPAATGVIQLNHPWDDADFGRDLGFPRAIGLDARAPLPPMFDGTGQGLFARVPPGASFANHDFHAQEVMNGSANRGHLAHRALWFYLLGEGVVRAGTANSDSHGLTDAVLGAPRNLVWTATALDAFDVAAFDAAVRSGRMIGTNGPVVETETTGADGASRQPSVDAFAPAPDAILRLRVSAAPWVPVDEVRIVVNGVTVRTLRDELAHPTDPFGADGLVRYEGDLALADLLDVERGDAWLVVEAGRALMPAADLDCDGIPDTGDNDGDGDIDADDVDVDPTPATPSPPEATSRGGCADDAGPLRSPPVTEDRDAPGYHFAVVVPEGQPAAFTNPLLLDLDGGGFAGVAR